MYILGIDPGFANLGLAIYDTQTRKFVATTVVTTDKSTNKQTLGREDAQRRFHDWYTGLMAFIAPFRDKIVAICTEGMSHPRSSAVISKLFMSWGGILFLSELLGIAVFQVSPVDLKKTLTGDGKASKQQVIDHIAAYDPDVVWPTKIRCEHVADACGAVLALVERVPALRLIGANDATQNV